MIRKININNFGIYNGFTWDSIRDSGNTLIPLKKVNIFYGRNYSGKTTLSRILRGIETKSISDKYERPDFELTLEGGVLINYTNFQQNNLLIRCFNEDFIKENLKFFIDHETDIIPFAIIGQNTGIEKQIEEIRNLLGSNEEGIETLLYSDLKQRKVDQEVVSSELTKLKGNLNTQLANKATVGADSIKKNYATYGDINYNITKLSKEIGDIANVQLLDLEKKDQCEKLLKEDEKADVSELEVIDCEIETIHSKVKELVMKEILGSDKIQELLENATLNRWAQEGYDLHKDDRDCKCSFCGNSISSERWVALDKHFDEETAKLKKDLLIVASLIENKNTQLSGKKNSISSDLFYSELQTKASSAIDAVKLSLDGVIVELEEYANLIDTRLQSLLRNADFSKTVNISCIQELNSKVSLLNDLIKDNNTLTSKLKDRKENAQKDLRYYEINNFIETINYSGQQALILEKEADLREKERVFIELEEEIRSKESSIDELGRRLNDEEEGANRVNHYLTNYFGHGHLKLQAIKEEKSATKKIRFNIVRNNSIAYHLSEGEISLISFCYFMAKLDDIHTLGSKPIILIDDPISSLDANHIFYLYSVINSELFVKNRFDQIFISTHNLDFLKYLKRLDLSSLQVNKNDRMEHFIINRIGEKSTISLMPSYLKDYVTEFNFLFDQIYKCANAEIVNDENHHLFYNFGNNARKFLEALLFYKYPSRIENQTNNANSKRLLKYFGNDNQAAILTDRVNNELSHLEEIFDRGMQPIDIPEMKKVAQFILDRIEDKDSEQYEALLESIGVSRPAPLALANTGLA
ncbi:MULTISPECIES: AAA family ATPase [Sphingobacterium]|uniref:AAA family ATPase n=1 Tax=Sphingobacterium TaxID=28453 RepID=UPI00104A8E81|nr:MULTISPECIES: AAA family ATPase [Sphingobacterium]MCW2263736.1 wobble nucleotide-excising tRNase [Sphingobacterium kitahiroshimense]TCR03788.1 wobble nucleotide-excising tRNase [Sphingobacterium sp. JUb78]